MDGVDNVLHAPIPSGSSSFVPTVLVNGSTIAEMDQEKYTIIKNLCENILHDYPAKHNIMVCIYFTPKLYKTNLCDIYS